MKKYLVLLFCIAVTVSCGRGKNNNTTGRASATVEAHDHDHEGHVHDDGHVHAEGEEHDHATPHVHEDGTECTGDHSHDEHAHADGHVHSEGEDHAGHDHTGHSHAEGDDHAGHSHAEGEEAHSENPDEIVFPAAQAAKTDFKVEPVTVSTFTDVIKTSGRIMPAQGQEVTLSAPVSGIVSFAGTKLAEGNKVGAENLFYISTKNIGTGDVAAKAAAAYRKAKADYERAKELVADKIVSQREFETITAEYEQAKTEYEALAGAQSDRGTRVASPIAGYVTTLAVGEGDFVEMGQTLATVSQNRRLVLRAEASQRYYPRLGSVRSANFTVPYDDATFRLADLDGRLISVGQAATTGTTLIPITFEFNNNGAVVPGSYVEVYLIGSPVADAITLPKTAITEQQSLYYVFVQLDRDCYQRREVKLGPDDGERILILSGLEPGERVVTRGAVNVKLAGASGAIPHSHEH